MSTDEKVLLARALLGTYGDPKRVERTIQRDRGGRPKYTNILNDEQRGEVVVERFCAAIELGMFQGPAAAFAGISHQSVKNWLIKGRKQRLEAERRAEGVAKRRNYDVPRVPEPDGSPGHSYWRFLERYEEAVALCQMRAYNTMNKAVDKGDWRAAVTLLKAHERGGFVAKPDQQEVEGELKVATDYGGVSVEAMEAMLLGNGNTELTVIDVKPEED